MWAQIMTRIEVAGVGRHAPSVDDRKFDRLGHHKVVHFDPERLVLLGIQLDQGLLIQRVVFLALPAGRALRPRRVLLREARL